VKILIVFIGILIMFTEFTVFQSDMNRYIRTREYVGMIAKECAETVWDKGYPGSAETDVEALVSGANKYMDGWATEPITCEIELIDPDTRGCKSRITGEEYDSVTAIVKLSSHVNDFFRSPFLSVTTIEQVSVYPVESLV
jgi:hypothetical protein